MIIRKINNQELQEVAAGMIPREEIEDSEAQTPP